MNIKKFTFLSLFLALSFLLGSVFMPTKSTFALAEDKNFIVCDENDIYLFERTNVVAGDIYIDKKFNKYIVYLVDEINQTAKARFVEKLDKPAVTKKSLGGIGLTGSDKKIGLYMTHNDESYLTGDGTASVYGKGGIHDIAKELAKELGNTGIDVYFDETLHIPHDSKAYSRSRKTARNLLDYELNAVFDIHRDGASRSTYAKTTNGQEHSTVRIVVGQANPKKEQNLRFALYLLSVSESICPWLFLDIYYAAGHYNQDLYEKSLLFEMGTHTIEKNLVLKTVPYLARVINTTLFNTTVDKETGELEIGTYSTNPTIDQVLNAQLENNSVLVFSSIIASLGLIAGIWYFIFKVRGHSYKKRKPVEKNYQSR